MAVLLDDGCGRLRAALANLWIRWPSRCCTWKRWFWQGIDSRVLAACWMDRTRWTSSTTRMIVPSEVGAGADTCATLHYVTLSSPESTQHIAPLRRELALPLASLTHLDLSRNSIGGALPDTMPRHLPALQILKLAGNLITALPSTIGDWRRLRVLVCGSECMGGNQLCVLPAGIGRLIALEELDVSHNQLVALPVTIGDLRSLRVLTVYGNRLRQLPSSISRLRSMRSLNIAKNEIELLPEAMAEMPATLEMVDLSNNQLQVLSVELAEFLRARTVLLAGNPFDMKRATVAGPLSSSSSSTCSSSVMHATERVPHYVPMPPMTTTTSNVSTTTDYDCAYPPLVAPTFAASPVASLLELSARSVIANRHLALPNPATIHRIPDRLIRLLCVRGGQCFLCQRVYLAEYRTHVEPKDYLGHCEVPQQVTLCSESCLRKCRSSSSSLDALSTAVPRCDIMAAPAGSASDSDESAEERAAMTPVQLATRLAHLGRHHGQRKHGHKKSKMWKWLDRIEHFQLQQQHEGLRQLQDGSVVMDDLQHPHDMVNDW